MAVKVWEPRTREGSDEDAGIRRIVLSSITAWVPEGARLIVLPKTVIAGPPGMSVLLPNTYCEAEFSVTC